MAGSLKEELERAMRERGELPAAPAGTALIPPVASPAAQSDTAAADFTSAIEGVTPLKSDNRIVPASAATQPPVHGNARSGQQIKQSASPRRSAKHPSRTETLYEQAVAAALAKSRSQPAVPTYKHLRTPTAKREAVRPQVHVRVLPGAGLRQPTATKHLSFLRVDDSAGATDQIHSVPPAGSRDLVVGVDFGTSATKVVISDRTLQQAYAIPFRNGVGAGSYILPSVLYESRDGYSLARDVSTVGTHPALKLALLKAPHDLSHQARIAAFVGLVIRNSRAWIFQSRGDEYRRREIMWSIALGQPADHGAHPEFQRVYETLAVAAWALSHLKGPIPPGQALAAVEKARRRGASGCEAEVLAMPEIAAQVYGFITSSHFDRQKPNVFLLADVGAGTLDACLFRVIPGHYSTEWNLEVYTSDVKEHGVMNLHDYRIHWWQRELEHVSGGGPLCSALNRVKLPIEQGARIPPTFSDYFDGVEASFLGGARNPDQIFYDEHVLRQIHGSTLYHAFSAGVLAQEELGQVPFFLCGGGSRMGFYQRLNESLVKTKNFGWLSASGRELTLPKELVADGLARSDFDRLSVAYGLSQLTLASAERARPTPRASSATAPDIPSWRDKFVDKDQV